MRKDTKYDEFAWHNKIINQTALIRFGLFVYSLTILTG